MSSTFDVILNGYLTATQTFTGKNVFVQWCTFDTLPGFVTIQSCSYALIQNSIFTRSYSEVSVNIENVDYINCTSCCFSLCIRNASANSNTYSPIRFGTVYRTENSFECKIDFLSFVACASINSSEKERYIVRLTGGKEQSVFEISNINNSRNYAYFGSGIHTTNGFIKRYQNCIYDSCKSFALIVYVLNCHSGQASNLAFINNIVTGSTAELIKLHVSETTEYTCNYEISDSVYIGNTQKYLFSAIDATLTITSSIFESGLSVSNTGSVTLIAANNIYQTEVSLMHIRFAYDCAVRRFPSAGRANSVSVSLVSFLFIQSGK